MKNKNLFFNKSDVEKRNFTCVDSGEFKNGVGTTYYTSYSDGKETTVALGFCGARNLNMEEGFTEDKASLDVFSDRDTSNLILSGGDPSVKKILANAAAGIVSTDPKQRVVLAHNLYHNYVSGVIRTYVDFMTEIAVDGLKLKVNKKYKDRKNEIEDFFKALFFEPEKNNNNLPKQVENILLDLITCNNAFVWTAKAPYTNKYFESIIEVKLTKENNKKLKSSNAAFLERKIFNDKTNEIESSEEFCLYNTEDDKYLDKSQAQIFAARKNRWSKKQIPNMITTLSPASVDIKGVAIGKTKEYTVPLDRSLIDAIKKAKEEGNEIVSPELYSRLNKEQSSLVFNDEEITHLKVKTPDYLLWGEPKILAALEPIARRRRRVIGDEQAASRLIRQILLVKIGNDKYVASREQIIAAASLFKGIGTTGTIFWNHLMEIEPIAPQDIADLLKQENYEQVENEIYESLGFPMFLSGRTTSINFSMAAYLVRPIVHGIKTIRRVVLEEYLRPLARDTCKSMGLPEDAVDFVFNGNILEDYDQLAKRLTGYATNKVASIESIVERLPDDLDWEDEKTKFNDEFKDIQKGKYGMLKTSSQPGRPGAGRPDGDPSPEKIKKGKISPKGTGDKPNQKKKQFASDNSTDEQSNESISEEVMSILEEVIKRKMKKDT